MKIRFVLAASLMAAFLAGPANASNFLGFHLFHDAQAEKVSPSEHFAAGAPGAPSSRSTADVIIHGSAPMTFTAPQPIAKGADEANGLAAITPVPEPATWAMFLLGFGAIGGMLRIARRPSGAIRGTQPAGD